MGVGEEEIGENSHEQSESSANQSIKLVRFLYQYAFIYTMFEFSEL